jgi:hypothetical protein
MSNSSHVKQVLTVEPKIIAARCHEIQTCLGTRTVPEYEQLIIVGMAVKVALHIRGLPLIDYETLKLVCYHFLDIPSYVLTQVIHLLAEIEFVYLQTEGNTIKAVLPDVPYYEDLYEGIGEYLDTELQFTEAEQLTLAIVEKLAHAPDNVDRLRNDLGADAALFNRNLEYGKQGRFLVVKKHRSRNIVINPVYFSENIEIFADHVAATNSTSVANLLDALKSFQGWPLSLIKANASIGTIDIQPDQIRLLERLAQEGIVKPPTITTTHSGETNFLFTPTPSATNLNPMKRDIYEKAMAIVAAIRQGQLLPEKYAIHSPAAVLYTLKTNLKLSKATTEFSQQYKNLVHLRVGQLKSIGHGYHEFHVIDTPDNREALDMAYKLVVLGQVRGLEVDEDARRALQSEQKYVESLVASARLREREPIPLSEEQIDELENLLLQGV